MYVLNSDKEGNLMDVDASAIWRAINKEIGLMGADAGLYNLPYQNSFVVESINEWHPHLECMVQQNGEHIEHLFK